MGINLGILEIFRHVHTHVHVAVPRPFQCMFISVTGDRWAERQTSGLEARKWGIMILKKDIIKKSDNVAYDQER